MQTIKKELHKETLKIQREVLELSVRIDTLTDSVLIHLQELNSITKTESLPAPVDINKEKLNENEMRTDISISLNSNDIINKMKDPNVQVFYQDDQTIWIIRKNWKNGVLTGYIALPLSHPCYNDDHYSDEYNVHGGVSWDKYDVSTAILNLKYHRFIGFDCAHIGDYLATELIHKDCDILNRDVVVKDIPFVYAELEKLAQQINERAKVISTCRGSTC